MTRQYTRRERPAQSAMPESVEAALAEMDPEPRAEIDRPEMRPAMRADPRERDSVAAARARAAEIMGHLDGSALVETVDQFHVDHDMIPDGWDYEWKRETVYGQSNPAYDVSLARTGWAPVPAERHPSFMPKGSADTAIRRDGMILMERPAEITRRVREIEQRKALQQVRQKEAQLGEAPEGHFQRIDGNRRSAVKIGKSYEPMEIPE